VHLHRLRQRRHDEIALKGTERVINQLRFSSGG
jgi:hypothetical protein